jgi:serine/threonine protein kinase
MIPKQSPLRNQSHSRDSVTSLFSSLTSSFETHSPIYDSLNLTKHKTKSEDYHDRKDKKDILLVLLLQTLCKNNNPSKEFFLQVCKRLYDAGYLTTEKYKDFEALKEGSKNILLEILHSWPTANKLRRSKSVGSMEDFPDSPMNLPIFNILYYSRSRYKNDFDEVEKIGSGGFGKVYKAVHKVDTCHYAIKKIRFQFGNTHDLESTYTKLTREVKSLASLCHDNIVRYNQSWFEPTEPKSGSNVQTEDVTTQEDQTDEELFKMDSEDEGSEIFKFSKFSHVANPFSSQESDKRIIVPKQNENDLKSVLVKYFSEKKTIDITLFIQMQLCSHMTLEDWMWSKDRVVDVKQIGRWLEQILCGLIHIHEKHLIHRDLKPSNVFLCDHVCKIGDFGLTTGKECPGGWDKRTHGVGTTSYGSPEQIAGSSYNELADMYSFGLIMFEMYVPFKTKSERVTMFTDIKRGKFPIEICKMYPKEMEIVKRCISTVPEKRLTAGQVLNMIRVDKDQIIMDQDAMIQMLLNKTRQQEEMIEKLKNK